VFRTYDLALSHDSISGDDGVPQVQALVDVTATGGNFVPIDLVSMLLYSAL
jgi:hypothetical protein